MLYYRGISGVLQDVNPANAKTEQPVFSCSLLQGFCVSGKTCVWSREAPNMQLAGKGNRQSPSCKRTGTSPQERLKIDAGHHFARFGSRVCTYSFNTFRSNGVTPAKLFGERVFLYKAELRQGWEGHGLRSSPPEGLPFRLLYRANEPDIFSNTRNVVAIGFQGL